LSSFQFSQSHIWINVYKILLYIITFAPLSYKYLVLINMSIRLTFFLHHSFRILKRVAITRTTTQQVVRDKRLIVRLTDVAKHSRPSSQLAGRLHLSRSCPFAKPRALPPGSPPCREKEKSWTKFGAREREQTSRFRARGRTRIQTARVRRKVDGVTWPPELRARRSRRYVTLRNQTGHTP